MSLRRVLLALCCLPACGDDEVGQFGPPYTFPGDTGLATTPAVYTSLSGAQTLEYAEAAAEPGLRDCVFTWSVSGSPVDIPETCVSCEFVFDVTLTWDPAASVLDPEVCAEPLDSTTETWAYAADYYGYADYGEEPVPFVLVPWYGYWYATAYADFDGSTFTWDQGYTDYYYTGELGYYPDYAGTFATWQLLGEAAVQ